MVHLISGEEGTFYYDAFFLDSLTFVGGYDSPGSAQEVFEYYDYLFVADSSAGIRIVDFIDPSNQTLVNSYETPGSAMDIWIETEYLYIADGRSGLHIAYINDFTTPVFVADYDTPGFASTVRFWNDLIFVADRSSFMIFRLSSETATVHESVSPGRFSLLSYPNPFNASASLRYNLETASDVNITVYDITGRQIAVIFDSFRQAGHHSVNWDASEIPSGLYFARLKSFNRVETIKMVLQK